MTLENLLRYTPKSNLDDYLKDNDLNRELYAKLKDLDRNWKDFTCYRLSDLEIFNEAYAICTHAFNDPHPEVDFESKYIKPLYAELDKYKNVDRILPMANAIFFCTNKWPENISRWTFELMISRGFVDLFESFGSEFTQKHGTIILSFPYNPTMPEHLQSYSNRDWRWATHEYDKNTIEDIVYRYPLKKDRLAILQRIKDAIDNDTFDKLLFYGPGTNDYFELLEKQILKSTKKWKPKSLSEISRAINQHAYEDFGVFLCQEVDWYAIPSEDIIPVDKARVFFDSIDDNEDLLFVLKFLRDFEDKFWHDVESVVGQKRVNPDYNIYEDIYEVTDTIAEFHKLVQTQIELLEKYSAYSPEIIDGLKSKNIELDKKNISLEAENQRLNVAIDEMDKTAQKVNAENEKLKKINAAFNAKVKRLSVILKANPINVNTIYEYACRRGKEEKKVISHLISVLVNPRDECVNKMIEELDNDKPMPLIQIHEAKSVTNIHDNTLNLNPKS